MVVNNPFFSTSSPEIGSVAALEIFPYFFVLLPDFDPVFLRTSIFFLMFVVLFLTFGVFLFFVWVEVYVVGWVVLVPVAVTHATEEIIETAFGWVSDPRCGIMTFPLESPFADQCGAVAIALEDGGDSLLVRDGFIELVVAHGGISL